MFLAIIAETAKLFARWMINFIVEQKVHMQNLNTQRTLSSSFVVGLCIISVLLAFMSIPVSTAQAVTSKELFAEVDEIVARIDVLQTELNKVQADYDAAVSDHEAANKAMKEAQERIKEAEERITEVQERLADRAASMYKNGPASYFAVLFGTSTFEEFLNSWDMIEKISSRDAEMIQEVKDLRAVAEAAREEYSKQKDIAAEKMATAKTLKEDIISTQAALTAEASKIKEDAMELKLQEDLEAERARQAAAAAEALRKQIEQNRGSGSPGGSVVAGNGQLANPCPSGYYSSYFGWRSYGGGSFHQGLDIAAPLGSPIYAADSGSVISATYNGGYNGGAGNWVVISHGNGMVTKYMHCTQVFVSVGDQVSKGQNIATIGSTGDSSGPHLHFQVEVRGTAVDPLLFL